MHDASQLHFAIFACSFIKDCDIKYLLAQKRIWDTAEGLDEFLAFVMWLFEGIAQVLLPAAAHHHQHHYHCCCMLASEV